MPSDNENGDSCQKERPSQYEGPDQTEESSEEDGVFSFHTNPVNACEKGLAFHTEILHLQLYVFWTLVAQEPWDLGKQLMHFADM